MARPLHHSPWFWLWLAGSSITVTTIEAGQWSASLGCFAAAGWWAARRGAWAACGAWLGLIGAFKPIVAPVALWVLMDRTRARQSLAPMIAGAIVPFLVGLGVFGANLHRTWLDQVKHVEWIWTPWSVSVHGLVARLQTQQPFTPFLEVATNLVLLSWAAGAAIVAASLWRVRHADVDRAFALLWISSLMAFPLGWAYYGWLAFTPTYALYVAGRLRQPLATTALWMLAFPPVLLWMGNERLWAVTGGSVYFWATAALWLAIWLDQKGETAA